MSSSISQMLNTVNHYTRAGQYQYARQLLWQVISVAPHEEQAWLLLASVARTIEERRAALTRVLALNPGHTRAKQAYLQALDLRYIRQSARAGVFISYAHLDEIFAVELADDLRFFGVSVWIDIADMPDGSDWNEEIEAAMKRSGLLLLVGSAAALRADNVKNEVRRFIDAGKIIIPVQTNPVDFSPLSLWYPAVDFGEDYSSGLQDLIRLLAAPEPALSGTKKFAQTGSPVR